MTNKRRGLYVVSKKRRFRLEAIADKISQEDYDLVALQEVWMPSDVELIRQKTQSTLPFAKHFYRYYALICIYQHEY